MQIDLNFMKLKESIQTNQTSIVIHFYAWNRYQNEIKRKMYKKEMKQQKSYRANERKRQKISLRKTQGKETVIECSILAQKC